MGRDPTERISDEDLSAYLDGGLPPLRRAQVEAAVRADRQLARRLAAYRAQEASLRQMASTPLAEPVPDRLLEVLRRPPAPATSRPGSQPIARLGWRLAASLLLASLLLGGAAGWLLHAGFRPAGDRLLGPFLRQAVLSHELFETSEDPASLQSADAAGFETMQSPFRTPIRIPQLLGGAWRAVQIRPVEGVDGPAIQIAYRGDAGLTSLLIRQHSAADDLLARFEEVEGRPVLLWLDGPLAYALVGDAGEEALRDMARSVYAATATGGQWQPSPRDLRTTTGRP